MIKNKTFLTLLAAVFLFATKIAKAECDGFYLAGRIGYAEFKLEDDRSSVKHKASDNVIDEKRFMASGGLGYRYKHVRAELEYIWRKRNKDAITEFSKGTFKSYSYMFVVYYDFFPYTWFTPFVDAGVGYTRNKAKTINTAVNVTNTAQDTNFTWSLGAGISAKITNRWNLDIGYRYYDMGDLATLNGDNSLTDQEIYMGLRYVL